MPALLSRHFFVFLKNKTDEPAAAFVDNAADGFLKFKSCFLGHSSKLCMKAFVNKFVKGFSENVGLPDLA